MPRHADALACLARLPGSDAAKKRAEAIVRTITGDRTVLDAADDLDVSTQRFHAIRDQALSGLIAALEPKPAGRPPSHPPLTADADTQGTPMVTIDPAILRECARLRTEIDLAIGNRGQRKKTPDVIPILIALDPAVFVDDSAAQERRHVQHGERLKAIATAAAQVKSLRAQGWRAEDAQRPRRELEAAVRRRACAVVRWAGRRGVDAALIARLLHVDASTLRHWQHLHDYRVANRSRASCLGPRPLDCPAAVVTRVRHHLALYGPGIGVPSLKRDFPDISWRDLHRLAGRFRAELWGLLHSCTATACQWIVPGSVWAADYWESDAPVDGCYRYVLDIRDLSTGYLIASVPCEHADAETTVAVLRRLILTLGAPLVFKTDNGTHFTAEIVEHLLQEHGITRLLSPPYLPAYNGACEAGHGSVKSRAEILARRDGTPGQWTCNHLEAARVWANRHVSISRPTAAEELWRQRTAIGPQAREQFLRAVEGALFDRRLEFASAMQRAGRLAVIAVDALDRQAVVATLHVLGYLITRSAPIRQPIPFFEAG